MVCAENVTRVAGCCKLQNRFETADPVEKETLATEPENQQDEFYGQIFPAGHVGKETGELCGFFIA
jgi:hypothetical protein